MKSNRCFILLGFLFALLGLCFEGQARQMEPGKTIIHFWYSLPSKYENLMKELVAEYNGRHPYLEVRTRNFELRRELQEHLKEGSDLPDIALINPLWQEELITRGRLVPVEDLMLRVGTSIKVVAKMDTFGSLWRGCEKDGKLWTLPYFAVNHAFLYNRDLFASREITGPPACWGEVVALGKRITSPEAGIWGFYPTISPENIVDIYRIFASSPGKMQKIWTLQGQKVLEIWVDMVNKYKISPFEEPEDPGKVAMFIGTTEDLLKAHKNGVRLHAARLPGIRGEIEDLEITSVAILKHSTVGLDKLWHFAYWLTEFPQELRWSLATCYLPANKQVTLSAGYFNFLSEVPAMRVFLKILESPKSRPSESVSDAVNKNLGDRLRLALKGKIPVKELLARPTEWVEALLRSHPLHTDPQARRDPAYSIYQAEAAGRVTENR